MKKKQYLIGLPIKFIDSQRLVTPCRFSNMENYRLDKEVFAWAKDIDVKTGPSKYVVYLEFDLEHLHNTEIPIQKVDIPTNVLPRIYEDYTTERRNTVNRESARNGIDGSNLRLYKTFKHVYEMET